MFSAVDKSKYWRGIDRVVDTGGHKLLDNRLRQLQRKIDCVTGRSDDPVIVLGNNFQARVLSDVAGQGKNLRTRQN